MTGECSHPVKQQKNHLQFCSTPSNVHLLHSLFFLIGKVMLLKQDYFVKISTKYPKELQSEKYLHSLQIEIVNNRCNGIAFQISPFP